jgi:hypothetical protein
MVRVPQHALKECGGRVEEAAARLGARERVWKRRQRQRLGIESTVPTDIDSLAPSGVGGAERTAVGA